MLELRAELADLGLTSFVKETFLGSDHLRLILTASDSKASFLQWIRLVRYCPLYVKLVVDVFWMSLRE